MFQKYGMQLAVLAVALMVPALAMAQATPIFPVASDLAQVKTDLLAWGTALIGVVLAIYAYRKVKSIAR